MYSRSSRRSWLRLATVFGVLRPLLGGLQALRHVVRLGDLRLELLDPSLGLRRPLGHVCICHVVVLLFWFRLTHDLLQDRHGRL